MALPFPSMDFVPFDVLTAEELDNVVANIESLSAGTGLATGSVTADIRSGGFKIGIISGATLATTGNKQITGLGFTPKQVRFSILPSANTTTALTGTGAMTSSSQYYAASAVQASASRASGTDACIAWLNASTGALGLKASYVSMDTNGFTINVSIASSAFDVAYEAYA